MHNCHYCGQTTDLTDGIVPVCRICDTLSAEDLDRVASSEPWRLLTHLVLPTRVVVGAEHTLKDAVTNPGQ
jgi:hypothetical protein